MTTTLRSASYGGGGGSAFDVDPQALGDKDNNRVVAIRFRAGSRIDSIQFVYANGDGAKHGGNGGSAIEYKLQNGERIIGAQVRSGSRVDAIDLFTNKNRNLNAGGGGGSPSPIEKPTGEWEIAGCFGRSGSEVDQIGFLWRATGTSSKSIHLQEAPQQHGGGGGSSFQYDREATDPSVGVTGLKLRGGSEVDNIQFIYSTGNGDAHGGGGGSERTLMLRAGEYFVGCSGRAGSRIDQLKFWTNKGAMIEVGGGGGSPFSESAPTSLPEACKFWEIAGASGRSGSRLDAIRILWRATADVESVTYENVQYDWPKKTLFGDPTTQLVEVHLGPNNTDVEQTMTASQQYGMQFVNTYTDSWSESHSVTLENSVTVSVSTSVGLDDIFSAGMDVSTTLTESHTDTSTVGGSTSVQESMTYNMTMNFAVTVPPHATVLGKAENIVQNFRVPYTATIRIKYRTEGIPDDLVNGVTGTMTGVQSNIRASYEQM